MSSAAVDATAASDSHRDDGDGDVVSNAEQAVREWAEKVPMGMGLCPWAVQSNGRGLLRVVACPCEEAAGAAKCIEREIEALTLQEGTPPLRTTLVACPRVEAWEEFEPFDDFVRRGVRELLDDADMLDRVTLVAFHPQFTRWHGLPAHIGVGAVVQSHWGRMGQKSVDTAPATIVETNNPAFGLRKVKVRFHDASPRQGHPLPQGLTRPEQYVPADWIDVDQGAALPDNFMYRAPYPTVHIIVNEDLARLRMCDVSRVKRINAKRMAGMGWEGIERHMQIDSANLAPDAGET